MREIIVGAAIVGALFVVIVVVFVTRRRDRGHTATVATGPVDPADLWGTIAELLRARRKIEAIKALRQATGLGLKEAKDAVEEFEATGRVPGRPVRKTRELHPDLAEEARRLKRDGKIIYAVKLVRERTGLGLKEAKDVVDSL